MEEGQSLEQKPWCSYKNEFPDVVALPVIAREKKLCLWGTPEARMERNQTQSQLWSWHMLFVLPRVPLAWQTPVFPCTPLLYWTAGGLLRDQLNAFCIPGS